LIFKVKGQGHQVKFLGEGIRHALHCPCMFKSSSISKGNSLKRCMLADYHIENYTSLQHFDQTIFEGVVISFFMVVW
jgi:hypothetical protein